MPASGGAYLSESECDIRSDAVDFSHGAAHQPVILQLEGEEIGEVVTDSSGRTMVEADAGAEERFVARVIDVLPGEIGRHTAADTLRKDRVEPWRVKDNIRSLQRVADE